MSDFLVRHEWKITYLILALVVALVLDRLL